MSITDFLNAGKIKKENEELKKLLTPEMQNIVLLQNKIHELETVINQNISKNSYLQSEINIRKTTTNQ